MKKAKSLLMMISIFACQESVFSNSNWEKLPGPDGAKVLCMAVGGDTLLVATYHQPSVPSIESGMVYSSIDAGLTWAPVVPQSLTYVPTSIGFDGNLIYASTDYGLFSAMRGTSGWKTVIGTVGGMPINPGKILVGSGALFLGNRVSQDSGKTWVDIGPPRSTSGDVQFSALGMGSLYFGNTLGIWRSVDKGNSWIQVFNAVQKAFQPKEMVVLSNSILIHDGKTGYRSLDSGTTWTALSPAQALPKNLQSISGSGKSFFATTLDSVGEKRYWSSIDNSLTWKLISINPHIPMNPMTYVSPLADTTYSLFALENRLIAKGESGIFASTDGGLNWSPSIIGLSGGEIANLELLGNKLLVVKNTGFSISDSTLLNWRNLSVSSQYDFGNEKVDVKFDRGILVINLGPDTARKAAGLVISRDGGATWDFADIGLANPDAIEIESFQIHSWAFVGGLIIVDAGSWGVSLSSDLGKSWKPLSSMPKGEITAMEADGARIYAIIAPTGKFSSVFYSDDQGKTWNELPMPSPLPSPWPSRLRALYFSPTHIFCNADGIDNYPTGFTQVIFTEKGNHPNWRKLPVPEADENFPYGIRAFAALDNMFFVGTGKGFFYSENTGATWQPYQNGLGEDSNQVIGMVIKGDKLVASTHTGNLWTVSIPIPTTTGLRPVIKEKQQKWTLNAKGYTLVGNPFTKVVSFQLPVAANIKLSLFSAKGRLVGQVGQRRMEKGAQEIQWTAPATGDLYMYRLTVFDQENHFKIGTLNGFISP